MPWDIDGRKFIVSTDSSEPNANLSQHDVIDSTVTVVHDYGYSSNKRKLQGWFLDNPADYLHLQTSYRTALSVTLTSDQGVEGTYRIMSLKRVRVLDTKRTEPVWRVDVELLATTSGSY